MLKKLSSPEQICLLEGTSHVSYFGEGNFGNGSTLSCCACSMNQHKKLRIKCCIF